MPKINQEEYEALKGMGSGWKWLARESNGNLYKHSEKPMKLPTRLDETQTWLKMDGSRFLFIKSTDEPYSIAELIEEYESEETEVKNKVELKSWFEDDKLYVGEYVKHKIDQLDEAEVLSDKWIDEHKFNIDTYDEVINVDDLQNLLVPKQEITEEQAWEKISEYYPVKQTGLKNAFEHFYYGGFMTDVVVKKPVIPKFVAEFLDGKEKYTLYELLDDELIYDNHDELARWLYNNDEKTNKERELNLVLAQRYGYEVEEEPKYRVILEENSYGAMGLGIGREGRLTFTATHDKWSLPKLTEQEIKDYDSRFWPFAVKVEELEE